MTTEQKRKLLTRIQQVEKDLEELRQARTDIALTGYASATISSGGGSKSYTRLDLTKLTEVMGKLTKELLSLRAMLNGSAPFELKTVLHIYC